MSKWKEIEKEDIDFDKENDEIEVLIGSDDWGNNYITLKASDIIELLQNNKRLN